VCLRRAMELTSLYGIPQVQAPKRMGIHHPGTCGTNSGSGFGSEEVRCARGRGLIKQVALSVSLGHAHAHDGLKYWGGGMVTPRKHARGPSRP
jgi:hypothetical protein